METPGSFILQRANYPSIHTNYKIISPNRQVFEGGHVKKSPFVIVHPAHFTCSLKPMDLQLLRISTRVLNYVISRHYHDANDYLHDTAQKKEKKIRPTVSSFRVKYNIICKRLLTLKRRENNC